MKKMNDQLGTCETPHFLGEPTLDRRALTQTPHYPLPQDQCRNWHPLSLPGNAPEPFESDMDRPWTKRKSSDPAPMSEGAVEQAIQKLVALEEWLDSDSITPSGEVLDSAAQKCRGIIELLESI